jgi:hypothetical protein
MYLLNGVTLSADMPFTFNGFNYPANWIRLSSPADKAAIGMTEIIEAPRPDDFYQSVVADPVNHGQWIVTPYTPDEMKPRLENYSRQIRGYRELAGVEHNIGADVYVIPTDPQTRTQFFNYRIIQERPAGPITTPYDFGTKVVALSEGALLDIEQKMENRIQGCLLTQLNLQASIAAGTTTTKEQIDTAYAAVP